VTDPAAVRLHFGPYRPPRLRPGQSADCRLRGAVVITGHSAAPLRWPWCCRPDGRGGAGPLVDAGLLRALRAEAGVAVAYWWGVTPRTVRRWRRQLGLPRGGAGAATA